MKRISSNYWKYGQSEEAGYAAVLEKGTKVQEIGPREMQPNGYESTYVRVVETGLVFQVLVMDIKGIKE